MNVQEIMAMNPTCCTPDTNLRDVARLMCDGDCGEIPVVESLKTMKLIGVVTDRDITCRAVAAGRNPLELNARDCMSTPVVTVTAETTIEECCDVMETKQIRRVPVIDRSGSCCGIVSQADLARHAPYRQSAELLEKVSQPAKAASA